MADTATYRKIWRWHFYAGLFVLPFVLILSVTGAIYLFKPQIDRWEERNYRGLSIEGAVSADDQLRAALSAYPGARFNGYRLPEHPGDAAMVLLGNATGSETQVFVSEQGEVLGSIDPESRISTVIATFHGSLLIGEWGDRLVELAASWTIVLILTGLYLWWPRPFSAAGTLYPRLYLRGRPLLKDVHRALGFWIAGLVLIMLASGLPWAGTWGSAFRWARTELGLVQGPQDWKIGTLASSNTQAHGAHRPQGHTTPTQAALEPLVSDMLPLAGFVAKAKTEHLAFPALVVPPSTPQRFGPPTGDVWTIKSESQNRPLVRSVTFDAINGAELMRSDFSDKHPIDRAIGYGIAWHEGQLFGLINQIIGLLTALALVGISLLGLIMWLKRRPPGELGAPKRLPTVHRPALFVATIVLGLLLPLFALSMVCILAIEMVVRLVRIGCRGSKPSF